MKIIKKSSGKLEIRINKKEWEAIGKKAQWSANDDSYLDQNTESPYSYTLELIDPQTSIMKNVQANIRFHIKPTEYEGEYIFYHGGPYVEDITITEDVNIDGITYPAGTSAEKLFAYIDDPSMEWDDYKQKIAEIELGQMEVPVKHYPSTR